MRSSIVNPPAMEFISSCINANIDFFIDKCNDFMDILFSESEKYNLTSIQTPDEFWIKHICDSVSILKFFPGLAKPELKIADIGAGAGLPSVPLALALPQASLFPIDSSHKKTDFIAKASLFCGISNISVVNGRGRELASKPEFKACFDIIIARAVGKAEILYTETHKMLKADGIFIFYKTPDSLASEISEVRKKSCHSGFEWNSTESFELPLQFGRRLFIYGKRDKNNPRNI